MYRTQAQRLSGRWVDCSLPLCLKLLFVGLDKQGHSGREGSENVVGVGEGQARMFPLHSIKDINNDSSCDDNLSSLKRLRLLS